MVKTAGRSSGSRRLKNRPLMIQRLALPGLEHDRLGLLKPSLRLGVIDAVTLVVVDIVGRAATKPDDQPALADMSISAICSASRIG